MLRYHIFLTLSLVSIIACAQPNRQKLVKMEMEAKSYFEANMFGQALPLYLQLDSFKKENWEIKYYIGACYLSTDNNTAALKYLEACLGHKDRLPKAYNYYLGRAYHLSLRFDEAIHYYNVYKEAFASHGGSAGNKLARSLEHDLEMCKNGKELVGHPIKVDVVNLGKQINTSMPEYAPIISTDESELIFTSNRPETMGGLKDPVDGLYYEDVYVSYKKDGQWSAPIQMNANVNSLAHDASVALSPDGQTLIIYRFAQTNVLYNSGDLYLSKLEGKTWGKAVKLSDKINTRYQEASASLSEDGNTLYFTSDKPGGSGGMDIYFSRKQANGEWGMPENMGEGINTPYDEDCPFIHPDGKTLYFSSKGHRSMGGFDIFKAEIDEVTKKWKTPENLGYPINSAHDDVHFNFTANGKRMYFASSMAGGLGDRDLYYADIENIKSSKVLLLTGIVQDSITHKPVEASIKVIDKNAKEEVLVLNSNSLSGKYTLVLNEGKSYSIIFTRSGYESHNFEMDLIKEDEFKELEWNIQLAPKAR